MDLGPASESRRPSATVLVIDDDRDIASGLTELIEAHGYEVISAADGRAALEKLRLGLRPDVIVLDVLMPGMDGWDFRSHQLREPALRLIPTLVISAAGFSPDSIRAQFVTAEYLQKPLSPDELIGRIRHLSGVMGR
jgi:CheY-like chemotaxis protein